MEGDSYVQYLSLFRVHLSVLWDETYVYVHVQDSMLVNALNLMGFNDDNRVWLLSVFAACD